MNTPIANPPRLFHFKAANTGAWRITHTRPVTGETLPNAMRLSITPGPSEDGDTAAWTLRGITSNERYVERDEKAALASRQEGLGRPAATLAALIPIRKTAAWWALTQQERREIFEAQSEHIAIGLHYLPAIARRLHHCRDLGTPEPFDFITWFEYAPADATAFEELVSALRASPEWKFVEREVDVRLVRDIP